MRLIDADDLINIVKQWYWDEEKQNADPEWADLWVDLFIKTIKDMPTEKAIIITNIKRHQTNFSDLDEKKN